MATDGEGAREGGEVPLTQHYGRIAILDWFAVPFPLVLLTSYSVVARQ